MSIKTKPSSVDMKKINNNNLNGKQFNDVPQTTVVQLEEVREGAISSVSLFKQIIISIIFSLFLISLGGSLGYTGIILPTITDPNSEGIKMTTEQVSLFTSFLSIGHLVGALMCSFLLLQFGQRRMGLIIIPMTILGWGISYFAEAFWLLCLSRFILGLMFSLILNCSTTYIAEIALPSIRGRLVSSCSLALQVGVLLVYVVGSTDLHWRSVGLICGLVPLAPCFILFFAPDSPRWLALKGHSDEKVLSSLRCYRGEDYPVHQEFSDIKSSINEMVKASLGEQFKMVKERSILKRLALLVYLYMAANFTGYYALNVYSVSIFQSATTSISPYLSTIICGIVKVVATLIYSCTIDHIGRRPMFLIFLALSAFWTIILGVFFYLKFLNYDLSTIAWLPLVCLMFNMLFSSLYQPGVILLRTELLPNSVRSLGVGIASFSYSLGAFLAAYAHPLLVESLGSHWTFWIYSIDSLIMIVFIYFFLPETKGKTLEEIEKNFN